MEKIVIGEKIMKSFGSGSEKVNVLDGVSVQLGEGEFVAIMGPSGSGKSTLMFALSGMDGVDSGRVLFEGKDLSTLKENELSDMRRTKMGFIFQQPTLLKHLNILDNIILPSMRDNRNHVQKITEQARMLMKRTGIEGLEKRDVTQVSGGQLQRVGLCRALMSNPKIIFGDEPTGALNSKSALEMMDLLADINAEGTAVLLVTHDAKVAARTERILFMRDGKIVSEMRLPKDKGAAIDDRVEKVTATMREFEI
ncbi:ABC transporter ATP-binding protein [Gorillibacterium timonense]|uniref:ABC transporter ATP-binding protein n=1 Tax=Gorillibacterium timonense TaxID=1689269 RepID=UPI00071E3CD5|nr:ABC transporter ATP-binding protein [Gorillibacterium timonense]